MTTAQARNGTANVIALNSPMSTELFAKMAAMCHLPLKEIQDWVRKVGYLGSEGGRNGETAAYGGEQTNRRLMILQLGPQKEARPNHENFRIVGGTP